MQPRVICAGVAPEKQMRLAFLLSSLGIGTVEAKANQWGQTLGALLGLDQRRHTDAASSPLGEILVMAFFSEELMDRLLKALRESGDGVALKAVLTPYNRDWTLSRLYQELKQEHEAMNGGERQ